MEERRLIAENERLKAENERLKSDLVSQKELTATNQSLTHKNAYLQAQNEELRRLLFGTSSEKKKVILPEGAGKQLELDFGELNPVMLNEDEAQSAEKETITYERQKAQKKHPGRHDIPDHLTIEEEVIEPTGVALSEMIKIGETIVDTLEYKPASLVCKRRIFPKYKYPDRDEFVQGQMPSRPIPKSIAEASLLAYLLVNKFVYHLPFYRQIQQFKQLHDVTLRKSTVNDWFIAVCTLMEPLYEALKTEVLQADYIQADESKIQVQDKHKKGKTHRGYQWVYYAPLKQLALFEYQKGRGAQYPKAMIEPFQGTLQTDGYLIYRSLIEHRDDIIHVGCMAHARRGFVKALKSQPEAAIAIESFQQLYAIERRCREEAYSFEQRQAYRQKHSQPILTALFKWAKKEYETALPKSPFGKALFYLNQRPQELTQYIKDGSVEIDNNWVENTIRPLALGRKNYLFAGSHQAAQRIAMFYSFFASCKMQRINPMEWLKHTLDTIPDYPVNRVKELLPGYKPED